MVKKFPAFKEHEGFLQYTQKLIGHYPETVRSTSELHTKFIHDRVHSYPPIQAKVSQVGFAFMVFQPQSCNAQLITDLISETISGKEQKLLFLITYLMSFSWQ